MIEGIVLAGGRSRRAGVFKPALMHRGRPLLEHAIEGLLPWCARVVVVAGHRHAEVAALVADRDRVTVVVNLAYAEGMFSSVRAGVAALAAAARGFLVLPVDCPLVEAEVYRALLAAFDEHGGNRPIVPLHAGRGGHPVLLPGAARREILAAGPSATLREVVGGLDPVRLPVAQPSVLMDLDTDAQIRALNETATT